MSRVEPAPLRVGQVPHEDRPVDRRPRRLRSQVRHGIEVRHVEPPSIRFRRVGAVFVDVQREEEDVDTVDLLEEGDASRRRLVGRHAQRVRLTELLQKLRLDRVLLRRRRHLPNDQVPALRQGRGLTSAVVPPLLVSTTTTRVLVCLELLRRRRRRRRRLFGRRVPLAGDRGGIRRRRRHVVVRVVVVGLRRRVFARLEVVPPVGGGGLGIV
mmetsp:Transcript_21885/g.70461  ORF Transcript_21885/g.70461 Transcript_21885/m.70461 type:complete len:212 (+) Transcript_21885:1966-2601(+)